MFACFSIPRTIITNNGTCFVSQEFKLFNGIRNSPYHPASNGAAEHAVQVVKTGLKKQNVGDIYSHLAKILFLYCNTPHSTTGVSPAELLVGRRLRSKLDLTQPDMLTSVEKKTGNATEST